MTVPIKGESPKGKRVWLDAFASGETGHVAIGLGEESVEVVRIKDAEAFIELLQHAVERAKGLELAKELPS